MRRFIRILKWTGIVLGAFITLLTITVLCRQNLHFTAPYPNIRASADSATIARGRHLVFGPAHCINCHNPNNPDSLAALGQDPPLTGAVAFNLPLGTIYSKNITPDKATGIGNFSDGEIARALRYGVHPDGTPVYDFMPFHNLSDEDLRAVISWLRAQKPVYHKVPADRPNALGYVVRAFLVKPVGPSGPVPAAVKADTTAAYGKYITHSIAECNGCHTQRDISGAFTGAPFAGGGNIEGFVTPNLTPDSSSRLFNWSQQDFIKRFRKGKLVPGSPMPWYSFGRMSDDELKAVYQYLRTLKPAKMPAVH
jgi:mono/diheme cytochrome c family protein